MTQKDLSKIDSFIERYNKLPKTADLKIKIIWGEATDEEKAEAKKILDEIDNIFAEIWAFVKVKYGENSGYLKRSHKINFDTEVMGIPVHTNDRNAIESSWRKGMREFQHLLRDLKLETETRIEHEQTNMDSTPKTDSSNSKKNTTTITQSNVIVGNVSHSGLDLSREKGNVNPAIQPTTQKRKKNISVIIKILKWLVPVAISAGILYYNWLKSK